MKPSVKRTERGWAGHFCGSVNCRFHRNTLLEYGRKKIVVSTVGAWYHQEYDDPEELGPFRFYETMAFKGKYEKPYWEADIYKRVQFSSPWCVATCSRGSDLEANEMHETVVKELMNKLRKT